jgi:hypothetical protein
MDEKYVHTFECLSFVGIHWMDDCLIIFMIKICHSKLQEVLK